MKILYINESPEVYKRYKKGLIPSHWFYGAVEMEKDGHEVIWCKEGDSILHDLSLYCKHKPDIIFLPNLNMKNHLLLLVLVWLRIIRIPLYAYLHHAPLRNEGLKSYLYNMLLPVFQHLFFLSEKSMQETIDGGFIKKEKCSVPGWGADMDFYKKIKTSDNGYFVSTGKENRDFDTLIEAFRRTGAPLKIMTAKAHASQNYENLKEKCKNIPNIEVILTENSSSVYPAMLEAMANAKALVCPLLNDCLTYCVGLSTIADAEGLHKPLLITQNPYHTSQRMTSFCVVKTVEDWVCAINKIQPYHDNGYSMQKAYQNMKNHMKL